MALLSNLPALTPRRGLVMLLLLLALAAGLAWGSYALEDRTLTGRRGPLTVIPRDYRLWFVDQRLILGLVTSSSFVSVAAGWIALESLARQWQKTRNRELAQSAGGSE